MDETEQLARAVRRLVTFVAAYQMIADSSSSTSIERQTLASAIHHEVKEIDRLTNMAIRPVLATEIVRLAREEPNGG